MGTCALLVDRFLLPADARFHVREYVSFCGLFVEIVSQRIKVGLQVIANLISSYVCPIQLVTSKWETRDEPSDYRRSLVIGPRTARPCICA